MEKHLLIFFLLLNFQGLFAQQKSDIEINNQFPMDFKGLVIEELDSSDIYPTLVDDFIVVKRNVN